MDFDQSNRLKQNCIYIRSSLSRDEYSEDVSRMIREILYDLEKALENPCPKDTDLTEGNEENTSIDFDASEVLGFTEDLRRFLTSDLRSSEMTSSEVTHMFFRRSCRCPTKPNCRPTQLMDSFIESFPKLFPTQ